MINRCHKNILTGEKLSWPSVWYENDTSNPEDCGKGMYLYEHPAQPGKIDFSKEPWSRETDTTSRERPSDYAKRAGQMASQLRGGLLSGGGTISSRYEKAKWTEPDFGHKDLQ